MRFAGSGHDESGQPVVAAAIPLDGKALAEVTEHLRARPLQHIARDGQIVAALALLRDAAALPPQAAPVSLAEIVTREGLVHRGAYESAVREYRPEQHGGLGELLVEQGVILGSMIQEAARQRAVGQASPA